MQNIELSDKAEIFIREIMRGHAIKAAAKKAGFTHPERDAYPLLLDRRIQSLVKRRTRARLLVEGAPQAYEFLLKSMHDESVDMRLRIVCAKELFAGGVPPLKAIEDETDPGDKDARQMTREELRAFIAEGEAELARRAKVVEPEALPAPQGIEDLL